MKKKREKIIAPSILSADFTVLGEQIASCERGGAKYLHFDVMDGIFVPSISFGIPVLASIHKACHLVLDVHLMITEPIRYVEAFKEAGADILTVHYEACQDLPATIQAIQNAGMKVGVSIKPKTNPEVLLPYLSDIDLFLLMTVEPGFGGQAFLPGSLEKIQKLHHILAVTGMEKDIEVDGGINQTTIVQAARAGANVFVAGSAVFRGDIEQNIRVLAQTSRQEAE